MEGIPGAERRRGGGGAEAGQREKKLQAEEGRARRESGYGEEEVNI